MSDLSESKLEVLSKAAELLTDADDFSPYLQLRQLLAERPFDYRPTFRRTFCNYYGLNRWVTEAFKDQYFVWVVAYWFFPFVFDASKNWRDV